jgi:chemotaxis protein histidine kinase CheA
MDVVADSVSRLHGWIQLDSIPDQGTSFRLLIPVRSTIQHAMVFRVGTQRMAIPMLYVREAASSITDERLSTDLMGLPLAELLLAKVNSNHLQPCNARATLTIGCDDGFDYADTREDHEVVLAVDEIDGPEEVVLGPLPPLLKAHPFCIGATLSGSGEIILVLDGHRLIELGRSHRGLSEEINNAG